MNFKYLDTKQLEAFSAVVSVGSMTGAARAVGRSQPVITRQIQDLEGDVGFALLHRNGPRISPTAQGLAFYEQMEGFLSGLRTISEKAAMIANGAALPIEIASVPALASSLLPAALADLGDALLPRHVHLHSTSAENVVQAIVARTADLGLASFPLDNPGIEIHWQAEVSCHAVVADSHPLAARAVIHPADLAGARLIMAANPYRLRMQIDQVLGEQGIEPASVIDSNATYVSLSLARQNLGIALVEPLTGLGLRVGGVTAVPLSFHIPFQWSLITAIGRPLSPAVETLIGRIQKVAEANFGDMLMTRAQRR